MAFTYTSAKYNVNGFLRENYYNGCAGSNGDTFVVGLNTIKHIDLDSPSTTTNITYTTASGTPGPGQTTITFSASAPFTGLSMVVAGT